MGFFNWAAPLVRRFGDRWSDERIAELAGRLRPFVHPGGRIADIGGGSGQLALGLAGALGAHVVLVDPTPQMLKHVPKHELVDVVLGYAEDIPFEDGTFDAVVTTDAFHHFRDQEAAVREMARVARTGGALHIVELDISHAVVKIAAFFERLVGEPAAFFTQDELCRFMSELGIDGECQPDGALEFWFLGKIDREGLRSS